MKGITPLLITIGLLALVLIFFNRPGSILDDCGQTLQAGGQAQYSQKIVFDGSMPGSDYAGQYKYALLVRNVPLDAIATKTEVLVTNSMDSAILIASEGTKCPNGDRIYILPIPYPMKQYFVDIGKRNPEGTYNMRFMIEYSTPASTPTPSRSVLPIPSPTPPEGGEIFILSDIFDGVRSVIAGIIAFITIPFLPPAP